MSTVLVSLEDILSAAKGVVSSARDIADREARRASCHDDLSNMVESVLYQDLDDLDLDDHLPEEEVEDFYTNATAAADREAWMVLG